jgi:hypothetical protein
MRTPRGRTRIVRTAASVALVLMAMADPASARNTILRWTHPASESVAGFRVHLGTAPRFYLQIIDVGLPQRDLTGIYWTAVSIPDDRASFVAVTAYGATGESESSNELSLPVPMALLGPPMAVAAATPPFSSGTTVAVASGSVDLLWLAATGPVKGYRITILRDAQILSTEEWTVSTGRVRVAGSPGSLIEVRVTPLDQWGLAGTTTEPVRIRFLDPLQDHDGDSWPNGMDNCPLAANPSQADSDGDGVGDACDNCPGAPNPDQRDLDRDGRGDACDADADGDGIAAGDLCPFLSLPAGGDRDSDGFGDACDPCSASSWSAVPRDPPDQNPAKARLRFSWLDEPDRTALEFSGRFNPADPGAPLDPVANGLELVVREAGRELFRAFVPPQPVGAPACGSRDGWRVSHRSSGESNRRYRNRSTAIEPTACLPGSAQGVEKITIKDRRSTRGYVEYRVKVEPARLRSIPAYPVVRLDASLTFQVAPSPLEASLAGREGLCAESSFRAPSAPAETEACKPGISGKSLRKLDCRGP